MLYTYSFLNKKRDLTDVLDTVVAAQPRFISFFGRVADATQRKHEWLEDNIAGRSVTITGGSGLDLTVSAADAQKLVAGMQLVIDGTAALFEVVSVSGTTVKFKLIKQRGGKSAPTSGDVLNIASTPIIEGSTKGEDTSHQVGTNYNVTQIFRKEITVTGSALAIGVYGNIDNQINRQTQFALQELTRDLNRVALFGTRLEPSATTIGTIGGLYDFGSPDDGSGLLVDAGAKTIDSFIINDGAQAIMGAGGNPTLILCAPGQARVLSAEFKDKVQVLRADETRGSYVANITNAINGSGMTIVADPDVPDTDVWVADTAGFGLSNLRGRAISDEDATLKNFDGICRMALGELTLEFKNAKQRLCLIKNVKSSAEALTSLRGE
jgi:hypothetical protein